ncbi:MAG TPA: 2-dehydro-3-deoxygalactonokinase [Casimicrobiaceae bacterium]|nr:2-dehydro-3-deoxygalactonokinase [Casimicrobiaceae bacterium]
MSDVTDNRQLTSVICIDWGTTFARAYKVDGDGGVVDARSAPLGIAQITVGDFSGALATLLGDWRTLAVPRIAAGMIGSRQGWVEAPYVHCPTTLDALASSLAWTPRRELAIVPGLLCRDESQVPDVMRGEEAQIAGAIDESASSVVAVLPGTHSKWAIVEHGRVIRFQTHMTGELYAVLMAHSILGRLAVQRANVDEAPGDAFDRGVARGLGAHGLGHVAFGARTLALTGELEAEKISDWLSGALIGHEIAAARQWAMNQRQQHDRIVVIGGDALTVRYARALSHAGFIAEKGPTDASVRGLVRIAHRAHLI